MTRAPCVAACLATSKPIPDEPPSTTTRLCCKPFPRCIESSLCTLLAHTVTDDSFFTCGSCIIVIAVMRLEKLRQVDLNLLITFAAIAEEKSITAAASRLLLSQPAVSRA
ncbi:MAG: LysR family transcriptional regulator, partial [Candidatus Sulfotelmatobacter sp.]